MERLKVTVNVITTYEKKQQEHYDQDVLLDMNCSTYGCEKQLITDIVRKVSHPKQLVKLSICMYQKENSKKVFDNEKISKFLKQNNGKYYFQTDQRCKLVKEICKEYPYVSEEILSYKEWLISEGIDPIQSSFSYNLIHRFNHQRIKEFKLQYRSLIEKTFGDMFIDGQLKDGQYLKEETK